MFGALAVSPPPANSAARDTVIRLTSPSSIGDTFIYDTPPVSTSVRTLTIDLTPLGDMSSFSSWVAFLNDGTGGRSVPVRVQGGAATISHPTALFPAARGYSLDIQGTSADSQRSLLLQLSLDARQGIGTDASVVWSIDEFDRVFGYTQTAWGFSTPHVNAIVVHPGDTITFVAQPGMFTSGRTGLMQNATSIGTFITPNRNVETRAWASSDGSRLTIEVPRPFWWDEAGTEVRVSASVEGDSGDLREYLGVGYPTTFPRTLTQTDVDRVGGANRFDVANRVAERSYPDGAPVVVVANGITYPDALSGAAAAAFLEGPLLLTRADALSPGVAATITRLGAARVVVAGGPQAVADEVIAELEAIPGVTRVERIDGDDRFATSRALANEVFGTAGSPVAYLATGLNFPDALSASAAAGRVDAPVILIDGRAPTLDSETMALLDSLGVERVVIVGGANSVSIDLERNLRLSGLFANVRRLSGNDRYETSSNIARDAFPQAARVFIATGVTFPDALAGAAWAAASDSPLIVVPGGCVPSRVVRDLTNYQVDAITLLGGTSAVSSSVEALTACPGFDWPAR